MNASHLINPGGSSSEVKCVNSHILTHYIELSYFRYYNVVCIQRIKLAIDTNVHIILRNISPRINPEETLSMYCLTLYVAVTQFTYGKLRHCYVKS